MKATSTEIDNLANEHALLSKAERQHTAVSLDIVIPIYNEADTIPHLAQRLNNLFTAETCLSNRISEVVYIFVDDGSTDSSVKQLIDHFNNRTKNKLIRLSRHFGHQPAITAGMTLSTSDLVVIMDADMQDPPEVILQMIRKWRQGFEVVYGQRINRKESLVKVFFYWLFYRIYRFLSPIDVPLDSGDFCLISRTVMDVLVSLPEKLRFPRGLRSWVGFPQIGVQYDRPERVDGQSKYTFAKLYSLATDGITSLSIHPLKLAQLLSFVYFTLSGVVLFFLVIKMFHEVNDQHMQFYILTTTILMGNGLILFCLYILGAYVGRGYLEIKGRPSYIIQEVIDMQSASINCPRGPQG